MIMTPENRTLVRVANFSEFPGGRHRADGPASGEQFRQEVLDGFMSRGTPIILDFNGVFTVAPSFLDEALGPYMASFGKSRFDGLIQINASEDPDILKDLDIIRAQRFRKK